MADSVEPTAMADTDDEPMPQQPPKPSGDAEATGEDVDMAPAAEDVNVGNEAPGQPPATSGGDVAPAAATEDVDMTEAPGPAAEGGDPAGEDTDDEVVAELDVCLNKLSQLTNPGVYLVQYPLRPLYRMYDERADMRKVDLYMPPSEEGQEEVPPSLRMTYELQPGEHIDPEAQHGVLHDLTLVSQHVHDSKGIYACGNVSRDPDTGKYRLFITPIDALLQMRPDLSYVDKDPGQLAADAEAVEEQAAENAPRTAEVTFKVRQTQREKKSASNKIVMPQMDDSDWNEVPFFAPSTREASSFHTEYVCDTGLNVTNPDTQMHSTARVYLDTLCGLVDAKSADLTVPQAIDEFMKRKHVVRFVELRNHLTARLDARRMPDDTDLLRSCIDRVYAVHHVLIARSEDVGLKVGSPVRLFRDYLIGRLYQAAPGVMIPDLVGKAQQFMTYFKGPGGATPSETPLYKICGQLMKVTTDPSGGKAGVLVGETAAEQRDLDRNPGYQALLAHSNKVLASLLNEVKEELGVLARAKQAVAGPGGAVEVTLSAGQKKACQQAMKKHLEGGNPTKMDVLLPDCKTEIGERNLTEVHVQAMIREMEGVEEARGLWMATKTGNPKLDAFRPVVIKLMRERFSVTRDELVTEFIAALGSCPLTDVQIRTLMRQYCLRDTSNSGKFNFKGELAM
mmetsp:Transcript_72797/g.167068  ORF Transcript_72797/g.167068 Transcript_72797/m.167068 type:complete len:679 (+) Transcript_72797:119-2155(+)